MADAVQELKVVGTRPIRPDGVDKVTGRANYAADHFMPGMIYGKVLRSPHAHALIKSIDTSKAEALAGVMAVMTSADMKAVTAEKVAAGETDINMLQLSINLMARDKVFYDGHAVAAVAATSNKIAEDALKLIEVDYEVLPHVIDVDEAMAEDAPVLHDDMMTRGADPAATKASNIASRVAMGNQDNEGSFDDADVIVEETFRTAAVHQGYIEPHACVVSLGEDDQATVWSSSQGHFMVRSVCSKLLGIDAAKIRVTPAELGGGFGGKTVIYLEPLALIMSRKAGRPVKMQMTRDEVFRASGPASASSSYVKIGAKKDGTIVAAEAEFRLQAGAFAGGPVGPACMTAFAPYDIPDVKLTGYDVVSNRPKAAAYRAPGAPMAVFATESTLDILAQKLGMDPIELRQKNAAKQGTTAAYGVTFGPIGYEETLKEAKNHKQYKTKLGPNQGRGVASGFWFNIGGQSSCSVHLNEDGSVTVVEGSPDVGGSRASMVIMVAETLGIDVDKVKIVIADTSSVGQNDVTGGSRVTFSTGMAVTQASEDMIGQLKARAAKIWDIPVDAVTWEDGEAKPAGSNAGEFDPMSLEDFAKGAGRTGGPVHGKASINAQGAGPGFATHICDVEVDPETGFVEVLRYVVIQDAGRAIHPAYVEGQFQGGAAQGIGWALNEEYIYNDKGQLENAGFLDYRMPVTSDLPMIDTVIVEVPNPNHPYGARGVGETPIVPPLAAVANAVSNAIGKRMTDLPMSPPKILAAIDGK